MTSYYVFLRTDQPELVAAIIGYWMGIPAHKVEHWDASSVYDKPYFDDSLEPNWYLWETLVALSNRSESEEADYQKLLSALSKVRQGRRL